MAPRISATVTWRPLRGDRYVATVTRISACPRRERPWGRFRPMVASRVGLEGRYVATVTWPPGLGAVRAVSADARVAGGPREWASLWPLAWCRSQADLCTCRGSAFRRRRGHQRRRERFLIWASRSLRYGSARWRGRERQIARQGERHRMGTGARRRTHTEECVAPSGDKQFQIGTGRVSKFGAAVGDEARRSRRATGRHIDRAKGETSSRHLRPAIWQGPPALIVGVRERHGPRATPAHRARAPCGRAGDMCASSQRHDTGTGRVTEL